MYTFILRVRLPDRPGALGAVASRIGSVRGDVVSVDVAERDGTTAVDEFIVELPDEQHLSLLLSEVTEVDGVVVDDAHPITGAGRDRRLDAYETARVIVAQRTAQDVISALTSRSRQELDALWSAVIDVEQRLLISSDGPAPAVEWMCDHVHEMRLAEPSPTSADNEVQWVELAAWDLVLLLGRPGWRLGTRDRYRLEALARLADERWIDASAHQGDSLKSG